MKAAEVKAAFDQQHPEAYAQVLAEARAKRTEAAA